jgi:hypothetical protein
MSNQNRTTAVGPLDPNISATATIVSTPAYSCLNAGHCFLGSFIPSKHCLVFFIKPFTAASGVSSSAVSGLDLHVRPLRFHTRWPCHPAADGHMRLGTPEWGKVGQPGRLPSTQSGAP